LGLATNESIVGFLYLGQPTKIREVQSVDSSLFVTKANISAV